MVMEKALPLLPTELVKHIEELAGIYRQPGYKELAQCFKVVPYPRQGWQLPCNASRCAMAIHTSIFWNEWRNHRDIMPLMQRENWSTYLKWLFNSTKSDNTSYVLRIH